ncbi:DUF4132 domain-containing protein [Glycomyces algeriensis]|uniref:DUF4132 domain-containing protein n=1 Tax=Glycomyces algeriensis TaxID=256037 RepID=A0A9W6LHQ3_9ACTN|nr:DUF4132 domain-containing protein [Glycomyces algeriensis]MDA1365853.1 DUF4132 domain-containing protein [Glycomyces algeriensis]MDR7351542.1 protein-disulfide isomerase-like protein with CxxC motif [Glycomyces algeriensis]GLI44262.1 hypothetical protein GALLR39Z86_41120 [Glycomyces algeriensis]
MTASVAPQEDQAHFPKAWERHVKPTRTTGKARKVTADADAGGLLFAEHETWARAALDLAPHELLRPVGTAFLDGTADPAGAAVATAVICHHLGGDPATTDFIEQKTAASRAMLARLAADHGLPFAAETAALLFTFDTGRDPGRIRLRQLRLDDTAWYRTVPDGLLADLRHRIAAASGTEYAPVRDALARRRTTPAERLAVTLLVPDERAWADEVCDEHLDGTPSSHLTQLLATQAATTAGQLDALGPLRIPAYHLETPALANLVKRLGAAAAPIVIDSVKDTHPVGWRRRLHKALAGLPSDAAAAYLVDRLYEPDVMGVANEFAEHYPLRTLRAAAARLPGAGAAAQQRLTLLLRADPGIEAAVPHLDPETRAVVAPLFDALDRTPYADEADLPRLLAAPPWTLKRAKPKAVALEGLEPPRINRVVWAAGEQEAFSRAVYDVSDRGDDRWHEDARRLELRKLPPEQGLRLLSHGPLAIAAPVADRWRARDSLGYWAHYELKRALARFETTVSHEIARAAGLDRNSRDCALPIANLPAARDMADALVRLKSLRATAVEWFDRHAADAAVLLVPDALGADKALRKNAATALAFLVARHGSDLVREAVKHYGDDAVAALEPLVDADPLDPVGVTIPKPVAWAAPPLLPQVLLAGGERALPPSAVEHLITVLALATPEYPYAGVEVVAEACDRASLGRFSLALFEQWRSAGAPSTETWALTQLAHFADDHTVRALAPLVAAWPGENQHQRAVKGLKVLGAIGTETAMRAVQAIADKAKFDAIRWEATEQINAIAANLGLTAEQLADRLLPDFGLGDEAALVVDYGPRRFTVRFDEQLRPFVHDGDGKPRKTLPKPGKHDAETAEDAYRRFTALKKDLRTVAADLVKRLEAAMIDGRRWALEEFREHYVEHALSGHLARRLVWLAEHEGARTGFRVAEDGTYSDVDDETFTPATESTVRLAHPALLGPEAVQAWSTLLADYEILQPFEQLNRPVLAFSEDELATGRLTRFEGAAVAVGPILGLVNRGWMRAQPEGGGVEPGLLYALPGSGYLTVMLQPGIYTGSVSALPDQELTAVCLSRNGDFGTPLAPDGKPLDDIDPVRASEALSGLARITRSTAPQGDR